jgi:transcriptional regulator with XRE-family HTH domain
MNSDAFSDRLREAIDGRSLRSFGADCGLSEGALRKYLAEKSEPGMSALVSMARTADVRIEWLATGDGPMRPGDHDGAPRYSADPLDEEVMGYIIEKTLEVFEKDKRYLKPSDMKKLIFALYNAVKEGEVEKQDIESNVILLKKFAS